MKELLQAALFEQADFRAKLAAGRPIPVFKERLKAGQEFMYQHFRETLDAVGLVRLRSWFMDQMLAEAWHLYFPAQPDNIALLAVGGYGRGELHPHSDIDVLILLQDDAAFEAHKEPMQAFITFMWDIKLEVGHGVRTLADCEREARGDLTIMTNMMETRALAGPSGLRDEMRKLTSAERMWPSEVFFQAKWDEQIARQRKYQDTEYNLEPHIKNCPGGLRDMHTIAWVMRREFNKGRLSELVNQSILSEFEYKVLRKCRRFLWQIRYALHMLAGREEDRLLFDLQKDIAELLGFSDKDGKLAVEHFMHQYYRYSLALTEMNDLMLLLFKELIIDGKQEARIEVINSHFRRHNDYLEMRDADLFRDTPSAMLEAFYILANDNSLKGVRADTIRALRDNRHSINDEFRHNPDNIRTFMAIMRSKDNVVRELTRMMRYGILGHYIPEFGQMIGHMQYDLFHLYTVDQHTLRCIRFIRQLRYAPDKERYPFATKLMGRVQKQEILYLTALLHDLGKTIPGEHDVSGEIVARKFCERHGLNQKDTNLICWLVRNHLLFSQASQRLDLGDPEALMHFARQVHDMYHLDHLFILSLADIVSTNPKLWTGWRAEQMRQLYLETKWALRRGFDNPIDKDQWIAETQEAAIKLLEADGYNEDDIRNLWADPGDEYFLRETPENLAWHARALFDHGDSSKPLVLIGDTSDRAFEGATQIFIFMKDQPNVFAAMTAALDQLHLNIQDARIITSNNNNTLDTYIVLDETGEAITDKERIEHIRKTLTAALSNPEEFPALIQRRTPRQLKQFKVKPKVIISNDPIKRRTVLEVIAPDRPGLLACMGRLFMEEGLNLQNAKILTEGERVDDIFYVTDKQGNPLSDPDYCHHLQQVIIEALEEQVALQASL